MISASVTAAHVKGAGQGRRECQTATTVVLADSLLERHVAETGTYPPSVGLSAWGTSAMRTSGDDVAEVLALIGVRPTWDEASRRVTLPAVLAASIESGR